MLDVLAGHAARVRAADPLAGGQDRLPKPGLGEELVEVPGGVGLATVDRAGPDSLNATWGPLVVHRLHARVSGPDPESALGALLDAWTARPRREPGPLALLWPSRDTAAVRALSLRGFAPLVAVAARPRGSARVRQDPRVRPAGPGDLEGIARLYEALVAYDAQFGWVTPRASTPARIRESLADTLPRSWAWVAEQGGTPSGAVIVDPPPRSAWIASMVTRTPAAYLGVMYVDPAVRGRGVGAALAAAAHARLDSSGVATTLLHHAVPNPLSAPFWARQGYRPVFTQWVRR
ncbi:GNAT family N-acetyltransferase [Nonomuraea sp. NPDC048826]|uniref:GNAT family N-acetyltransferase n=1 Tax=Nonomuraea sp. NPDC048826 TaxID=3364347 RepID=UPI0037235DF4